MRQKTPRACYNEAEMGAIQRHIQRHFGEISGVLHPIFAKEQHVDICVVAPTPEKNYYTLVTMGMGAEKMNLPKELSPYKRDRAELILFLPPDWKVLSKRRKWSWPLNLLSTLAQYPEYDNAFLSVGHSVEMKLPLARHLGFRGAVLTPLRRQADGMGGCLLPSMEMVDFYQVIPLFPQEMEFKTLCGLDGLLRHLEGTDDAALMQRKNPCVSEAEETAQLMDYGGWHADKIPEKQLPVELLAAYSHMAIYLRWCMERELMGSCFLEMYPHVVDGVLGNAEDLDLREFVRDDLYGFLGQSLFSAQGAAFAAYYYNPDDAEVHHFPSDVDDYALHYFGEEAYHSEKFQDEAYLFVPYDEEYYQGMKGYLDRAWENWKQENT